MFRKLRNKFLILNITIISIVMICAFVVIYFITYNNIRLENQDKLKSGVQVTTTDTPDSEGAGNGMEVHYYASPDSALTFTITVDEDGDILNIASIFDLPYEAYENAAEIAWNNKNDGTLTIESREWQYAVNQRSSTNVNEENGQEISNNDYQIVFLDITQSNKTLFELFITLLIVGLAMLFVIFFISLYFANRAIRPISETWERQKQFIADASHELKTPLSIITANYDALLANQEETIKSQLKWFDYMKIGTDRMTKLINELLTLAKIGETNKGIQKSTFNISETTRDTVSAMEAAAVKKGIKLSLAIEPDIMIKGSPESIKQVVEILFDNAVKYVNNNGEIDISLIRSKRHVSFSITNSGEGIAYQDLPKVFDRFYRTDPSRASENNGYGLGLSIAKSIIESAGGRISVSSVEKEYTTFSFTIGL